MKKKIREKKKSEENIGMWKDRKIAKNCIFLVIYSSGGSKSKLIRHLAKSKIKIVFQDGPNKYQN
jgi:hypothetical protein